jgi:AAA-like domain/TIR domain
MSPSRQRFRYDVFISYSHRDKDWVRGWLVPRLKDAAVRVCIDHESFEPGAHSITEMERAVLQSRKTVLILTPDYLQSEWSAFENILVQTLDPAGRHRRLLPVLLVHCEPPPRIGIRTYIDLTRSEKHAQGVERLIAAIRLRLSSPRRSNVAGTMNLPFGVPTGALSPEEIWKGPLGAKDKLSSFMRDHVLQGARMPVIFVIDEADRVFGRPYRDDFFALLRGWHDRRARDALWNKLNLVLVYSTDPRQAIQDLNQSPFNVGTKIQLDDFSVDELWELNHRYGRPLRRRNDIMHLMGVIAGHPFLAQQALYALSTRTHPLLTLLNTATADVGPFGDHLHHYRTLLEAEPALRQGMRQVINNGT